MSKLWGWVVAAFGLLGAALLYVAGQRNRAREAAKQARVALHASEANREVDNTARKAQTAAKEQTKETQREADERPTGTRPDGHFRR